MKYNQKRFSVVEILIIIVMIGLLGVAGWFVYDHQSSDSGKATETNDGQTIIQAGASIRLNKLKWDEITSETSIEETVDIVKNTEGGYFDPNSVKPMQVGGVQVAAYNAGHTSDCIVVYHKTSKSEWLEAIFCAAIEQPSESYKAANSEYYEVFLAWLEDFVTLNE